MQPFCILLFILVLALQAGDGYLTWRILQRGGRELNPITAFVIRKFGTVPGLAIAKLFPVVMTGVFLLDAPVPLLGVILLYTWVVVHNWKQLRKGAEA